MKSKRKRQVQATGWRPVRVELGIDDENGREDEPEEGVGSNRNHYDCPKLMRSARQDLPVGPGEGVGIFYGLEVLENYEAPTRKKGKPSSQQEEGKASEEVLEQQEGKPKGKPSAKKKTKKTRNRKGVHIEPSSPSNEHPEHGLDSKNHRKENPSAPKSGGSLLREEEEESRRALSQSWCEATSGVVLHALLVEALRNRNFAHPTPIQSATLSAAILGRRNIVGAAPTGSGKTIAFLLPIMQALLEEKIDHPLSSHPVAPRAFIITPTRELATQILEECDKLIPGQGVSLVGGVAMVKQKRLLRQRKPSIIIGTPGRLWAMISSGEHAQLQDLSRIQFLVLDEADRMTQDHCYPQLLQILNTIHDANPSQDHEGVAMKAAQQRQVDGGGDDEDEDEDEDCLVGLPGVPGEAPLVMLQPGMLSQTSSPIGTLHSKSRVNEEKSTGDSGSDEGSVAAFEKGRPQVHRQTFMYSATLTLPHYRTISKPSTMTKKTGALRGLHGAIGDIMGKARPMGETKIVDLSSPVSAVALSKSTSVQLPKGLTLELIKCTQRHKDSHLYAYLVTTVQGSSGPCLIFCNSIAAVRRVGSTLQTLGIQVRTLHAQMQQRARFKAVESLSNSKGRPVVVCTDVAARGLDIPSVSVVVHYDASRTVDVFVHRSGRTARGVGASAVGRSLSLISPAEDKAHSRICNALGVSFDKALLDGRLLNASQERVNLACKVIAAAEVMQKRWSHTRWFLEKAKETDIEIEDDMLETDDNLTEREQLQMKQAQRAKARLRALLQEPMKTQRYGKFLSTNSARRSESI